MTGKDQVPDQEKTESASDRPDRVLVWDLPVRLFHWSLVLAVVFNIATGLTGGLWQMEWHMLSGQFILGLVIFRVIWGGIGGRHARFVSFLKGPVTVIRYALDFARRREAPTIGHNPLGGWSVILILAALAYQAGTGLFSNDDIFVEGPLFKMVGKERSDEITGDHLFNINLIYGLIVIHLAAVAVHWFRGENLIKPMINGHKADQDLALGDDRARPIEFVLSAALAVGAVYWILSLG